MSFVVTPTWPPCLLLIHFLANDWKKLFSSLLEHSIPGLLRRILAYSIGNPFSYMPGDSLRVSVIRLTANPIIFVLKYRMKLPDSDGCPCHRVASHGNSYLYHSIRTIQLLNSTGLALTSEYLPHTIEATIAQKRTRNWNIRTSGKCRVCFTGFWKPL